MTIPQETIHAFARSICEEGRRYGFAPVDTIRLINEMFDLATGQNDQDESAVPAFDIAWDSMQVDEFPLRSERLQIRRVSAATDLGILEQWIGDEYGKHFLLSCATAQRTVLSSLLQNPSNEVGIIETPDGKPIGAVAYLDLDPSQRRAELRKLIGDSTFRGKGYAEEATCLWIEYGARQLSLEKLYVSTLQTHLRNIRLNESIGFRVEGVLHREVRIADERFDVLRMGLCLDERRR
jgi:RimJ/RimL family protein N-acetyltransferase